jgi:hypothetical protein
MLWSLWVQTLECSKYKRLYEQEKKKNELYMKHKNIIDFLEGIAVERSIELNKECAGITP